MPRLAKIERKKPESLMSVAYDTIKDNICNNTIEQGSLLSEIAIAEELGMSRTPVREAIKMLERDGLIEVHTGIGAYVKPLSYKEITDTYEVRKVLELLAIETAVKNVTAEDISHIKNKFNNLLQNYRNGNELAPERFAEIDLSFHIMLIDKCDNALVKKIMHNIMNLMKRVQILSFKANDDVEESTMQHLHLLGLLEEGDTAKLSEALSEHITWAASLHNTQIF